jgi:hypothetical protein
MKIKTKTGHVPVAYACNPSYSGSRDQEDCGSKPTQANSLQDPISKKLITKKGWWSSSCCRSPKVLSSKPSAHPKKTKTKTSVPFVREKSIRHKNNLNFFPLITND